LANKKYVTTEEFSDFKDNHFYHLSMKVASISGQVKVLIGLTMVVAGLVIGVSFI